MTMTPLVCNCVAFSRFRRFIYIAIELSLECNLDKYTQSRSACFFMRISSLIYHFSLHILLLHRPQPQCGTAYTRYTHESSFQILAANPVILIAQNTKLSLSE